MKKRVILVVCALLSTLLSRDGSVLAGDNVPQASRIAVQAELLGLATRAQQFFWHPSERGHSFATLCSMAQLSAKPVTSNGTYSLPVLGSTYVVLHGQGVECGTDGAPISVDMTVFADSVTVCFNN